MRISDWSSDVCSSDLFLLVVWLTGAASRRNVAIQAAYLWELDTSLREHGIEIARPQRDLRLRSAFGLRSEEPTSELQSLMRISYAVLVLKTNSQTMISHTTPRSASRPNNSTRTFTPPLTLTELHLHPL